MRTDMYSVGFHDARDLDQGAKLTKAGLEMLREIYAALSLPCDLNSFDLNTMDDLDHGPVVPMEKLASHRDKNRRRSVGQIRDHLIRGGYLGFEEIESLDEAQFDHAYNITGLALSKKAYAALKKADEEP